MNAEHWTRRKTMKTLMFLGKIIVYVLIGFWALFTFLTFVFAMIIVPGFLLYTAVADAKILLALFAVAWMAVGLLGLYKLVFGDEFARGEAPEIENSMYV